MDFKKVMFLSPHTDDSEIGCGGLMNKLASSGTEIYHYAFSDCKKSVPKDLKPDILRTEFYEACQKLNLPRENYECFDFNVRYFPRDRQDILEKLIMLRNQIAPDLVVCPSLNDFHQDHSTLAIEALRAFKGSSIINYEMPWNMIQSTSTMFVALSSEDFLGKLDLINTYNSQNFRRYTSVNNITALSTLRGSTINVEFAEMYEVTRWIIH